MLTQPEREEKIVCKVHPTFWIQWISSGDVLVFRPSSDLVLLAISRLSMTENVWGSGTLHVGFNLKLIAALHTETVRAQRTSH